MNQDRTGRSWISGPLTGRQVLLGLIAFFGIVFAANISMAVLAIGTFDGTEAESAYRAGQAYNHVLEQQQQQVERGWTASLSTRSAQIDGRRKLHLSVVMADKQNVPLDDLEITALLRRPTVAGMDQTAPLSQTARGTYEAELMLPAPGNWEVRLDAVDRAGTPFKAQTRIVIDE